MRFILSTDSSEYKLVISDFNRHMTGYYTQIQRIERIQNKQCCLQYLMFKKNFKSQFSMHNEKSLYHGCSEEAADLIIKTYFNRSFAGVHGKSTLCFIEFVLIFNLKEHHMAKVYIFHRMLLTVIDILNLIKQANDVCL